MKEQQIVTKSIDTIIRDPRLQVRVQLDRDLIDEYRNAILDGAAFEPIDVFCIEEDGDTNYYVANGFHRISAHLEANEEKIRARLFYGDFVDALEHAIESDAHPAKARTNEDKRRSVVMALEVFSDWSDRKIAHKCGVSNTFVGNVRREMIGEVSTVDTSKRKGRDGKEYPATKEQPKPEPIEDDPPERIESLPGQVEMEFEEAAEIEAETPVTVGTKQSNLDGKAIHAWTEARKQHGMEAAASRSSKPSPV